MPAAPDVLKALRRELITAGIVRHPSTAGPAPPLFLEPLGGAPAPGERELVEDDASLVVTARHSGDMAEDNLSGYRRRVVVDLVYRTVGNVGLQRPPGVQAAIEARIVRRADFGFGYVLDAGGPAPIYVISASLFGGLGRVAVTEQGTTDVSKLLFEVYA